MLDGLTEKIREIESNAADVLYRRDYQISSEKQMSNLRSWSCSGIAHGCALMNLSATYRNQTYLDYSRA